MACTMANKTIRAPSLAAHPEGPIVVRESVPSAQRHLCAGRLLTQQRDTVDEIVEHDVVGRPRIVGDRGPQADIAVQRDPQRGGILNRLGGAGSPGGGAFADGVERDGYGPAIMFGPILLKPQSSGRISLRSADPTAKPIIDPDTCPTAVGWTALR
jgi:hypothetical protein